MLRRLLIPALLCQTLPALAQDAIKLSPLPKLLEETSSGPWGTLEYYKVRLSCPPQYLSLVPVPSAQTEWIFPYETEEELLQALAEDGMSFEEIAYLLKDRHLIITEEFMRIFPSPEVITGMPAALRSKFYRILARFPQNTFHHRPAFLNTANVSLYFKDSDLSVTILQKIALLAYPSPSGHGFFLSDIPYLLKEADGSEAERRILNALLRVPALMVRLNLSKVESVEGVSNYWKSRFRNKQIAPLFDSIMANPHIQRIDIGHLLPPTARQNLNSFPGMGEGLSGSSPDWFWTCYNFFRFTPVNVYANLEGRDELLAKEFSRGTAPYEFGDMLLLKSQGRTIHGCIYIAEDIVYTKNGAGLLVPTILMKLQDMVSYHDLEGDIALEIYRKTPPNRKTSVISGSGSKSN